jgi:hypothetical protein
VTFFEQIVLAISPQITERTLTNLRNVLEQNYIRATARDASPEDAAFYSARAIAACEEIARIDNAKTIIDWAQAICDRVPDHHRSIDANHLKTLALHHAKEKVQIFQTQLQEIDSGSTYPTLTTEERFKLRAQTQNALHSAQREVAGLEIELGPIPLSGVLESAQALSGRSSHRGPSGQEASGTGYVDPGMPDMP